VLLEYPQRAEEGVGRLALPARPAAARATPGTRIGVSLVGAGNFATATLLPGLGRDGRADFRGILTGSGLSASDVGAKKGFAYATAQLGEILADDATRSVVIASRHDMHAAQAIAALGAGKTVFTEKPLCLTRNELAEVVDARRRSPADLMVGFNRRFSQLSLQVKGALVDRTGPAAISCRVNAGAIPRTHWTQRLEEGGGRIVGELCHFIDLCCYFAGAEPVSVFSLAARDNVELALRDTLSVTLAFANGSVASLLYAANGDTSYPKERVEIFCEGSVWVIDDFKSLDTVVGGTRAHRRLNGADKGHRAEMAAFLDLAQGKPSGILTFEDCVVSTAATFAVIESLTTGAPVGLDQPSLARQP
jgi:predicted dehydrogenase